MKKLLLVVDTNILISALLKPHSEKKTIFNPKIELITPNFFLKELDKYAGEFQKRMKISNQEFDEAIKLILDTITIIPENDYSNFLEEAAQMLTDKKDSPFLALAIAKHCPIWSNDKGFKKQNRIRVFSTQELLKELVE